MNLFALTIGICFASDPEEIITKALEQQQVNRSVQKVEMTIVAKNGAQQKRTFELKLRQVDAVIYSRLTFLSPSDIAGTIMLIEDHPEKEDPQLLYLPALKRVQRISGRARKGAFMGSDFLYSDLEYSVDDALKHTLLEETDFTWVIETKLDEKDPFPYRKSTVDRDTNMLLQMQYQNTNKETIKTLKTEDIRQQDGIYIPFKTTMFNHKKETQTELQIVSISLNVPEENLPLSEFRSQSLPLH